RPREYTAMPIKIPADVLPSEITPRNLAERLRELINRSGAWLLAWSALWAGLPARARAAGRLPTVPLARRTTGPLPGRAAVTGDNNYYECGTDNADPARNAHKMALHPWTVAVEGLVGKPRRFDIDQLLRLAPLEERIYRLRCVEAWSMVVPWVGFPLA